MNDKQITDENSEIHGKESARLQDSPAAERDVATRQASNISAGRPETSGATLTIG